MTIICVARKFARACSPVYPTSLNKTGIDVTTHIYWGLHLSRSGQPQVLHKSLPWIMCWYCMSVILRVIHNRCWINFSNKTCFTSAISKYVHGKETVEYFCNLYVGTSGLICLALEAKSLYNLKSPLKLKNYLFFVRK